MDVVDKATAVYFHDISLVVVCSAGLAACCCSKCRRVPASRFNPEIYAC
jgi:hypothetical protein